jgi:putative sterol carrier protein
MALVYGTDEWEKEYLAEVARRMEQPPPYIYFIPEWAILYERAIKQDAQYKELAKDWEGTVCLHVEAKPEYGMDNDFYLLMDLWHGDCRSARVVPPEAGKAADYVITGSMDCWVQVGRRQLDTVKGMMQGKFRLKGNLPTIVRYVRASTRLTDISADVGGRFPDELTAVEVQELRKVVQGLSAKFLG